MTEWDLEPSDSDEARSPVALPNALESLRRIAIEFAPGLRVEHPGHDHRDVDRYPLGLFGVRIAPFFELSNQVYAYVEALNRALGDQKTGDPASPRGTISPTPPRTLIAGRLFVGRKPIHLGVVDRYLVYPASPPLSAPLLRLVMAIPGMDDVLIREQHDVFGWHYHYCDQGKRRSDVLMSFDRKHSENSPRASVKPLALCWEPHAVNKARFKAKPWLWGDRKRETIYTACAPDLAIVPALKFKPPSQEAEDVWPLG